MGVENGGGVTRDPDPLIISDLAKVGNDAAKPCMRGSAACSMRGRAGRGCRRPPILFSDVPGFPTAGNGSSGPLWLPGWHLLLQSTASLHSPPRNSDLPPHYHELCCSCSTGVRFSVERFALCRVRRQCDVNNW